MKKAVALILVISMVFVLCACGASGPKGKYKIYSSSGTEMGSLTFSGNKITMVIGNKTVGTLSESVGTFTYENGKIFCSFKNGSDTFSYNEKTDTIDIYGTMKARK